jgi:hypothetical protein
MGEYYRFIVTEATFVGNLSALVAARVATVQGLGPRGGLRCLRLPA